VVSKLLNHTSIETTQKFYLQETPLQVIRRAYIPWLPVDPTQDEPLPYFLTRQQ
jgi:hypothetical protein